MYYVEKVLEILNSTGGTDFEKVMQIYEKGFFAQHRLDDPKPPQPEVKDRYMGRLIRSLTFFDSRRVPSEYWEDLCPYYLSAVRAFIVTGDLTRYHGDQQIPAVELALDKNMARAKELVERGVYDWTQYHSWFTMGDY